MAPLVCLASGAGNYLPPKQSLLECGHDGKRSIFVSRMRAAQTHVGGVHVLDTGGGILRATVPVELFGNGVENAPLGIFDIIARRAIVD